MNPIIQRPLAGVYVSIEGIEGVGKTHIIQELLAAARNLGDPGTALVVSCEITQEGFGKDVVDLLARHDDQFYRCGYPLSEALVFFSMKLFELVKTIVPRLESGYIVLEDRSADSNCAYAAVQLAEQLSVPATAVYQSLWEARARLAFTPDSTLLLVDDVEECLGRAQKRDGRKYSDSEQLLVRRVHDLFSAIAGEYDRVHVVDLTNIPMSDRAESVWRALQRMCSCSRDGGKER